ncbi:MAG: hypothetical protein HDQ87_10590 [Clostridia bacterium]|nr:hypothetical protein [Clostridia bacterium]
MDTVYTKEIPLRSVEVDFNGTWMPSNIFETMQEAAEDDAARYGFGRIPLAQNWGLAWVLTRIHLQMERYPRLGTWVRVSTWALRAKTHFVPRQFLFEDDEGIVGRASSQWMLLDLQARSVARTSVLGGYAADFDVPPVLDDPRKFRAPGELTSAGTRLVRYSDVDINAHMNNTKYLNWICDLYPVPFLESMQMQNCRIAYVTEAHLGEEVTLLKHDAPGSTYICGRTQDATIFEAQVDWAAR